MKGQLIQDYVIKNLLKEDLMGKVYLALHLPSKRSAVIRIIPPSSINKLCDEQLQKGSNALAGLNHPGIAKFYQSIRWDGQVYLVSEFVSGISLRQYLQASAQPLPPEKIWDIISQIAEAFHYAHTQGVPHLGIHPGNILLTADEQITIDDFGIASLFPDFFLNLQTNVPEWLETSYVSPEHILHQKLDVRSDIYALGIILFELVTRQIAYPPVLTQAEIRNKILHHSLPPIKLYTHAFAHSYAMQAIIDKATAKNPSYRIQDLQELKEYLMEEKDERETLTIQQLMLEVNERSQLSASERISTIKLARQRAQRKRAGQVILIVGLMAGALTAGRMLINFAWQEKRISSIEKSPEIDTLSSLTTSKYKLDTISAEKAISTASPDSQQEFEKDTGEGSAQRQRKPFYSEKLPEKTDNSVAHAGFSFGSGTLYRFSAQQLQNRLEAFYAALRSKDLHQTESYYAPRLTKFFNESHINQKQLQHLLLKAWKRTPEDKHEILWDTFQYSQDQSGNYTLEFYMHYVYRRANKNWRKRKIYTQIKMDKNLQIYSMTGD